MKATLIGFALLMSGTAIAQTTTDTGTMTDADTTVETTTSSTTADTTGQTVADTSTSSTMTDTSVQSSTMTDQSSMTMASNMTPASGAMVQPGNTNPEEDARGITVMSDPAMVPAGWNGVTGTAVGGPLVDPATGATVTADSSYPACSASVTDNCLQTYERGRAS